MTNPIITGLPGMSVAGAIGVPVEFQPREALDQARRELGAAMEGRAAQEKFKALILRAGRGRRCKAMDTWCRVWKRHFGR